MSRYRCYLVDALVIGVYLCVCGCSGESGAGKTEATKSCLQFLTIAAELASNPASIPGKDKRSSVSVGSKGIQLSGIAGRVIAASPILEAFGNAKTIRNPNSSRFGKWLELIFNSRNALSGSIITSYLLEKSRVTRRDPEERNYHIFYQLLRGLQDSVLMDMNLHRKASKYRYLERTGINEEPADLNDAKNFKETMDAFKEMGFDEEEILTIQRIIGGLLHLGNIDFVDKDHGEASAVEPNNESNRMAANLFSVQVCGYDLYSFFVICI
jgi:myosin heavy subunit